jgi:hypothetical protein
MERSSLSRGFIAGSIKRLEAAGHLSVIHSNREGTCNQYMFGRLEHFQRIPYELFDDQDLTTYEKAFLLCLRPFFINEQLVYLGSIKSVSKQLDVSYQQVYKPYKSLIAKGYLLEKGTKTTYLYLKGKIDWSYDYRDTKVVAVIQKIKLS